MQLEEDGDDDDSFDLENSNRGMPSAYLDELSHRFEDMGELVPGDNGQTKENPPAEEAVQSRWIERQGRELEFVVSRKHSQLIVDGMLPAGCRFPIVRESYFR
jgi:hypothetical protein